MLLTMDVGNTNIKFGLWLDNQLSFNWRVHTRRSTSGDELALLLEGFLRLQGVALKELENLVVASVVPPMRPAIERLGLRYIGRRPIFVEAHSQSLMPVLYDDPREVGADRVVGAIAAYRRCAAPLIVVDFGTATTFDCVSAAGEYLGGAIAPGFRLSAEALFHKASRLPKMEQFYRPVTAIAKDTVNSLNSGLVIGYAGLVEGLARRIASEMTTTPKVIATGGLAGLIAGETAILEAVWPDLTMEGLKIVYDERAYGRQAERD
ncbi:MAG: type III pantothenate kinase [Deltaproteobacteria bacterium]|jgi:type III pantothenate kinase|nr:type III pantothenate kinase [Deltaproteobacteria bacterium]